MNSKRPTLRSRSRRSGFTLIEIMVVIGIIVLLMGSAIFFIGDIGGAVKPDIARNDIAQLSSMIRLYSTKTRSYPKSGEWKQALTQATTGGEALMKSVPNDPWGREYSYVYPGKKNTSSFDLFSLGKDGIEGTEDDIGNW